MVIRLSTIAVLASVVALGAPPAGAQQDTGFDSAKQFRIEQLGKNHVKLVGAVEVEKGDMRFFADEIESWTDTHRLVATGNVVFSQGRSRIAAERLDFNTETQLGTFYNAVGTTVLTDAPKKDMLGGQDPDMYFYGDTIEKVGEKRYRVTRGGFTTCVQPTPRWELTSRTVTLNLDHYALLTSAVLKAKSVPVLYLPVLYYPINKEDRATGFLMPTYGTSNYRGFTLSDAFFWAINRSHDATFLHDWFSKRGQGMGAEYRYVLGPGTSGQIRYYTLREHASTYTGSGGTPVTLDANNSYEIRGNATYNLGHNWTARGRVDYFSSLAAQQTFHTNIYDSSRRQRSYGGSVSGTLAGLAVNGSYDRSEFFFGTSNSAISGNLPRITVTRSDRPLFGLPIYFSAAGEYGRILRQYNYTTRLDDTSLTRAEFAPVIRVPYTKLRWLTVNSTVTWRGTYWSRSSLGGTLVDDPISRKYIEFLARVTGPVFTRVWNTPGNFYAEKFKHTIEPAFTVQRITKVDNYDRIVKLDGNDYTIGDSTRVDYGLTNRFLAKRRSGPDGASSSREFLSVGIRQTYYTDARASQYDYNYSTSFSGRPASKFSSIRLTARATPAERINGTFGLEFDHETKALQSMSATGQVALRDWLDASVGYSRRKLKNSYDPYAVDNFINGATSFKGPGNRVGGAFSFNYDVKNASLLTSRVQIYYNAQCCGFTVEYQTYNFPSYYSTLPIRQDRRFNFSFTLAGLGTFSNFLGAFGGNSSY